MKKIPLAIPHMSGNEMAYIEHAFNTNWIAPVGPNVDLFEKKISSYTLSHVAATSSGTAAIHLALIVLGVTAGDHVFCPSFTFSASANPIHYQGAEAVFIDSEIISWNMSPVALEKALLDAKKRNKLPKAVIVTHIYGQPAKMTEILEITEAYGVPVIEDAAESLGSTYKGMQTGTIGSLGIYSFNGNKIITTSGGGMLVSQNETLIQEAKFLSEQAKEPAPYYQHEKIGYNYRLSNISAGIGCGQIEVLDERIMQKRCIFAMYQEAFSELNFQQELPDTFSNRWLTAIQSERLNPLLLKNKLGSEGIEGRLLWKPLHMQPVYKSNSFYSERNTGEKSSAQILFETGFCLPSATQMTQDEQWSVIQKVSEFMELKGNII
ncbi:aminotransferase class I/II-fold pyridoxal phosphate-dependent enzyme [Listeria booriae]|uniref:Aminotransferase class I/II-fold pyridoxal phosphate-dependent enzyme n=1 Tax=Listeria booriae TaxID=1552123 RepID=A0A841ZTN0_9LIST|nr:aminotransferase class I/II-fold pyridoxal phosphate-dependent enzyme [Listeria booriae]MBC1565091.1 aminotransferase class I/II-fold pyridoxal phosphate-dependent enzyme [Listeria booriae]